MALRNSYTIDGVPLTHPQGVYFPEKQTGIRVIPAKRTMNIAYPGLDGNAFLPRATFEPGGVTIKMYVSGTDHEVFMENLEFLNGLFLRRHKLLTLRHDYDKLGLESRYASIQVINGTEPSMINGRSAFVEYIAEIPSGFWRSGTTYDATTPLLTTSPQSVTLLNFDGGNAPISDALVRFKGGFASATITDKQTGDTLICNTPCSNTEYVIVDTVMWTARKVTTDTWTGGTPVDATVISNRGMGSMITFEPDIVSGALRYSVTASVTTPSGTPSITVRAKRSYL